LCTIWRSAPSLPLCVWPSSIITTDPTGSGTTLNYNERSHDWLRGALRRRRFEASRRVRKCVARGASLRKESRGGHTREDFPKADPEFATFNLAHSSEGGTWDSPIRTDHSPLLVMPDELQALLEEAK
jgi:hypothetical protein